MTARERVRRRKLLVAALEERGWSQGRLADESGVDRSKINAYCTGRGGIGDKNAARIATALGLPSDYFTGTDALRRDPVLAALEDLEAALAVLRAELGFAAHAKPEPNDALPAQGA